MDENTGLKLHSRGRASGRASPHAVATRRSPKKRQNFDALPLRLATVWASVFFGAAEGGAIFCYFGVVGHTIVYKIGKLFEHPFNFFSQRRVDDIFAMIF